MEVKRMARCSGLINFGLTFFSCVISGTFIALFSCLGTFSEEGFPTMGRSILLWLLGVRIPIIILLALFWH
jgi:hypothetical protein